MKRKYTPNIITELAPNEIFVFGSNYTGLHVGGAAYVAYSRFGAIWGRGIGFQGQSYAIPTTQGGVKTIKPYVDEFIEFAKEHRELIFMVTKIGCGIAGFKNEEIAPLFFEALNVENIVLPKEFADIIEVLKRKTLQIDSTWDSYVFRKEFCHAMIKFKKGDQQAYSDICKLRIKVFENTMELVNKGWYMAEKGKRVEFDFDHPMIVGSKLYEQEFSVRHISAVNKYTTIDVANMDCLKAARILVEVGYNPVVLNMASRRNPGGNVTFGSGGQEETLFRRTNLFRFLYQFAPYAEQYGIRKSWQQYPLDRNYGGVYTPNVTVFRDTEQKGYALLEEPYKVSFVSVAGMKCPDLMLNEVIADWHVEPVKNKIRTIFRIALVNGHDAIVLGALGCGAYKNPPRHVARLFHEVIKEDEFMNKFKTFLFAIIDDHNSHQKHNPDGNYIPFYNEFYELLPEGKKVQETFMMWKMGAGNSGKRFDSDNHMPRKDKIATKNMMKITPMPIEHVTIPMDVVIPAGAMEIIKKGHIPDGMEDHWFMYCDEDTIRFYRSWNGFCIFEAKYNIDGRFCAITELKANRKLEEYGQTDDECDIALFMALIIEEYGGDSRGYWSKVL